MASPSSGGGTAARNRARNSNMAAYMKRHGITRTSARCPICNKIVGIPMDRHFYGGVCR